MNEGNRRVFISHSREDQKWNDRLAQHLRVSCDGRRVEIWDDQCIQVGSDWRVEIERKLRSADLAVLLVSVDFLTSPFITTTELPTLIRRHSEEHLVVVPVLVRPCNWKDVTWLRLQVLPKNGSALSQLSKRDLEETLAEIAAEISAALVRFAGPARLPKSSVTVQARRAVPRPVGSALAPTVPVAQDSVSTGVPSPQASMIAGAGSTASYVNYVRGVPRLWPVWRSVLTGVALSLFTLVWPRLDRAIPLAVGATPSPSGGSSLHSPAEDPARALASPAPVGPARLLLASPVTARTSLDATRGADLSDFDRSSDQTRTQTTPLRVPFEEPPKVRCTSHRARFRASATHYYFDDPARRSARDELAARPGLKHVMTRVARWRASWGQDGHAAALAPLLLMEEQPDGLRIRDTRPGAIAPECLLEGLAAAVYRACGRIRSNGSLRDELAASASRASKRNSRASSQSWSSAGCCSRPRASSSPWP